MPRPPKKAKPFAKRSYSVFFRDNNAFDELIKSDIRSFVLLAIIAKRAAFADGEIFKAGQAAIGKGDLTGLKVARGISLTEKHFPGALKRLTDGGFIKVVSRSAKGTIVELLDNDIFGIMKNKNGTPKDTPKGTPKGAPRITDCPNTDECFNELRIY